MKPKFITKECKKHGLTEYILENRGAYRCKKCRSTASCNTRSNNFVKLKNAYNGCCCVCGYDRCFEALEFHHLKREDKLFSIAGGGFAHSMSKLNDEASKCILVCANCHREIEAKIILVE